MILLVAPSPSDLRERLTYLTSFVFRSDVQEDPRKVTWMYVPGTYLDDPGTFLGTA